MKTTINGKEIKLYDDNGINTIYTDLVSEYISKGFVVNFRTVRGSQGEESKIDLTNDNGKTIYRIWILIEYFDISSKKLMIVIEKFSNSEASDILWFGRGEKIFERIFYFISRRSRNIYVESKDDFETIREVQKSREDLKYKECCARFIELSDSCKKIALKIIRKKKGYKTVKIDDLNTVRRRHDANYYYFDFNEKENFVVRIKEV